MHVTKIFLYSFIVLMIGGASYAATPEDLLGHKWYFALINNQGLILADFGEQKAEFEFMKENIFYASLGCGHITGTYVLTPPNTLELKMTSTTTDQATCKKEFMDLETSFISLLPRVKFWEINSHVLYFKANLEDTSSIAVLSEQKPY